MPWVRTVGVCAHAEGGGRLEGGRGQWSERHGIGAEVTGWGGTVRGLVEGDHGGAVGGQE